MSARACPERQSKEAGISFFLGTKNFMQNKKYLAFLLSQNLSSLHDFDDLGKSCRIGDGGTRPHAH